MGVAEATSVTLFVVVAFLMTLGAVVQVLTVRTAFNSTLLALPVENELILGLIAEGADLSLQVEALCFRTPPTGIQCGTDLTAGNGTSKALALLQEQLWRRLQESATGICCYCYATP